MIIEPNKLNEVALLCLTDEMFKNIHQLRHNLTELYLGPAKEYQLDFDLKYLTELNWVFDVIILSFGVRNVVFKYPKYCDFEKYQMALKEKRRK